jgi:hypothetical protein
MEEFRVDGILTQAAKHPKGSFFYPKVVKTLRRRTREKVNQKGASWKIQEAPEVKTALVDG